MGAVNMVSNNMVSNNMVNKDGDNSEVVSSGSGALENQRVVVMTSEAVGVGHPDKVCDRISDAILDACLRQDENSRVAVETMVTTQFVVVAGEVTTKADVNFEDVVRKTLFKIGYVNPRLGFDYKNAEVLIKIHEQSPDISMGVDEKNGKEQGAGDQGMMFGYACRETDSYFPLAISLAQKIVMRAKEVREKGILDYLYPDCKSQVSVVYENGIPKYLDNVVFSSHHSDEVSLDEIKKGVMNEIIVPVCGDWINDKTRFFVNPTGRFVNGGPAADTGLTGRKIIIDTYGGYARHGGGAFSGKDPSKVDRSAAYAARWVAKNVVAAGLSDECEIQLAYVIGYDKPVSMLVDTKGTEKVEVSRIEKAIKRVFDLSPKGIIKALNLKRPIYEVTSFGGHFGREPNGDFFTWERLDKVEELKKAVGN